MKIKTLIFLLITLAFSTSSYSNSQEGNSELSEVPLKVQQTIIEHTQAGKIKRIKKEEVILLEKVKDEKTDIYLVKVQKHDGKNIWITIHESGELMGMEEMVNEEVLEDIENEKKRK